MLLYNQAMTKLIQGERAGRRGRIRLGCAGVLFDPQRTEVLLTRRADNGEWCLPGGAVDPGESVGEACEREFLEETGLRVHVLRLTSVYSSRDELVIYPDGNEVQIVVLGFEVELRGGAMGLSPETTDIRFFPLAEVARMRLFHSHNQLILEALERREATFLR